MRKEQKTKAEIEAMIAAAIAAIPGIDQKMKVTVAGPIAEPNSNWTYEVFSLGSTDNATLQTIIVRLQGLYDVKF